MTTQFQLGNKKKKTNLSVLLLCSLLQALLWRQDKCTLKKVEFLLPLQLERKRYRLIPLKFFSLIRNAGWSRISLHMMITSTNDHLWQLLTTKLVTYHTCRCYDSLRKNISLCSLFRVWDCEWAPSARQSFIKHLA